MGGGIGRQTCSTRRTATISTTPRGTIIVLHASTHTSIDFGAGLRTGIDLALELERGIGIGSTSALMTPWQFHSHDLLNTLVQCSYRDEA